jgi:hypothetical protein
VESKMSKDLKKFLTKNIVNADVKETLAVADKALGSVIKDKLNIKVFLSCSLFSPLLPCTSPPSHSISYPPSHLNFSAYTILLYKS